LLLVERREEQLLLLTLDRFPFNKREGLLLRQQHTMRIFQRNAPEFIMTTHKSAACMSEPGGVQSQWNDFRTHSYWIEYSRTVRRYVWPAGNNSVSATIAHTYYRATWMWNETGVVVRRR